MIDDVFPKHEASLHITHNQHKAYYQHIEKYIEEEKINDEDWANPTSKERAIKYNSIWEVQWYPNTPIGFNKVYGATLEEIIKNHNG